MLLLLIHVCHNHPSTHTYRHTHTSARGDSGTVKREKQIPVRYLQELYNTPLQHNVQHNFTTQLYNKNLQHKRYQCDTCLTTRRKWRRTRSSGGCAPRLCFSHMSCQHRYAYVCIHKYMRVVYEEEDSYEEEDTCMSYMRVVRKQADRAAQMDTIRISAQSTCHLLLLLLLILTRTHPYTHTHHTTHTHTAPSTPREYSLWLHDMMRPTSKNM